MASSWGGLFGGAIGAISNAAEAGKAWERQKKLAKNQIQWRVSDLKKAGLNPLLSISGGLSGGAGRAPQAHSVDWPKAATEGTKAAADKSLKKKQEGVASAQAHELATRAASNSQSVEESKSRQFLLERQAQREAANATAAELDLERARAENALYEELGAAIPATRFVLPLLRGRGGGRGSRPPSKHILPGRGGN